MSIFKERETEEREIVNERGSFRGLHRCQNLVKFSAHPVQLSGIFADFYDCILRFLYLFFSVNRAKDEKENGLGSFKQNKKEYPS